MKEVKMLYSEYKKLYSNYKTVYGSYDKADKTIIVELPDDAEYAPIPQEKWIKIRINKNNIVYFDSFALIKLPYHSNYKGFTMCVSLKLARQDGDIVVLSVKEDFTFRIKKKGKGRYNKHETIEEQEITSEELAEAFRVDIWEQQEPIIHTPEILEPVQVEAIEELRDAD